MTMHAVAGPSLPAAPRLLSLDVFRGFVILAMLVVNNPGDPSAVGYWWKHPNWIAGTQAHAYAQWWTDAAPQGLGVAFTQYPLWKHCTLADFVMPWFILVIGVAMPFSVAAARARGASAASTAWRTLRRGLTLMALGWVLVFFRDPLTAWVHGRLDGPLVFTFGMDVLQLLGAAYVLARLGYALPAGWRVPAGMGLLLIHYAILKFYPQPGGFTGEFTARHNAISVINGSWPIFLRYPIGEHLAVQLASLMSAIPTAGTMLLGTWIGDRLRRPDLDDRRRARGLALAGLIAAAAGFAWAFDLPFNKPRWSPCYLLYAAGVGAMLIAAAHELVDRRGVRRGTRPLVVLGVNSIAAYWLPIMAKIVLLNLPHTRDAEGNITTWGGRLVDALQASLGTAAGSWAFTVVFVVAWVAIFEAAYRRRIIWKI